MKERYPLDFETRVMVGAVCWVAVLVLIAAPLGDFAMFFVWPYVLISTVLVFACVLEGPPEKRRRRRPGQSLQNQATEEPEADPRAQIDEILGLVEYKVTRLEEIEQRCGPDVRQKIEEEIRQREFDQSQEVPR